MSPRVYTPRKLTYYEKMELLEWGIKRLRERKQRYLCGIFSRWVYNAGLGSSFYITDLNFMHLIFVELWDEIQQAFIKTNSMLIIGYADSYRYQGRIRLLNRVMKRLERNTL